METMETAHTHTTRDAQKERCKEVDSEHHSNYIANGRKFGLNHKLTILQVCAVGVSLLVFTVSTAVEHRLHVQEHGFRSISGGDGLDGGKDGFLQRGIRGLVMIRNDKTERTNDVPKYKVPPARRREMMEKMEEAMAWK